MNNEEAILEKAIEYIRQTYKLAHELEYVRDKLGWTLYQAWRVFHNDK